MPDPSTELRAGRDQASFSWICPSCGRRVPRTVASCRCGAGMPADAATPPLVEELAPPETSSRLPVLLAIVLTLTFSAGAYWMFLRPVASPAGEVTEEQPEEASAAASEPRGQSPEARAWDAAASALPPLVPGSDVLAAPPTLASAATIEEMVDKVMPAIVLIEATSGRGSGFFVRHDTLITNVHVVQNDTYVTVKKHDGSSANARVESRAPAFDIAILKVAQPSSSQPVIQMGSTKSLRAGQEIIVIGSALGTLQNSVSRGVMSGLRSAGGATLVQTDAATNPGNSGGPMLDRNGNVVGITTMGYKGAQGLNFGVAIDHARDLLEGRQPNIGTAGGLQDIQSQARGTESDRQQQQGEEQFRNAVRQLAMGANQIDAGWQRFRQQCYTSPIPGNYDREWFAVLVPRGIPGDAAAGCISYYQAVQSDIRQFHSLMQRATNDARRASVLPGTVRDVLRTNRLDFDWDR
ncbi:MAG TPA: trypsin-like peptidase domain-containing protein [Vicinamibacterales bacterium]|nr:trypsin-like peptidase domain-containing protein [Vicinamibacterales bacterium]